MTTVKMKSACKPGSVEGNHSSKDPCRQGPQAAYPEARTNRRCLEPKRHEAASLFGLAPRGVYLAAECCHRRGALLPHRFTLTVHPPLPDGDLGGLLSVALSVGSRPPGVTWHVIRGSPDFPPRSHQRNAAITRPTSADHLTDLWPAAQLPRNCIASSYASARRPPASCAAIAAALPGGNSFSSSSRARRISA